EVEPNVPIHPAAAEDLTINGSSAWGTIARVVKVRPGVAWVDASTWSGYVLDADTQPPLEREVMERLGHVEEVENGWWREGAPAGAVAGAWPEECVRALARADRLTQARAAEQLRRDVVATARALGLSDEARQQVVARWDRATVTDVEEVPYDDERGPGPVAPERSGRAGTQRTAGPGGRAERPGVVDEGGPVEGPGAGDGDRPSAAGEAREIAGRDLVDLPAPGQGPGPGEVLDRSEERRVGKEGRSRRADDTYKGKHRSSPRTGTETSDSSN